MQLTDALFLKFGFFSRIWVVNVTPETREGALVKLRNFAEGNVLEFEVVDGRSLSVDDVRGEIEIIFIEGKPYHQRKNPAYWPQQGKKMIVVEGLTHETPLDILRAFLYVVCLGSLEVEDLPSDKLPKGSGFVFLAEERFPFEKFNSISNCWREEVRVVDA